MYHIKPDGKPGKCRATINENCPYIQSPHFPSLEKTKSYIVKKLENDYSIVTSVSKNSINEGDVFSANISKDYAHLCVEHDHMHNSRNLGNELELLYYSSPQGQLELKRRIDENTRPEKYLIIKEKLEDENYKHLDYAFDNLEDAIEKGNQEYNVEWSHPGDKTILEKPSYDDSGTRMAEKKELKHSLINHSYTWLKNLNTKEQEAISALTSSGFIFLQIAHNDKGENDEESNDSYDSFFFDSYVPKDPYYDKYGNDYDKAIEEITKDRRKFAHNLKKEVMNTFNKAPTLEKPIITYRGTNLDEIRDTIGKDSNLTYKEFMNKLENGDYNGNKISSESRMKNMPVSSSIDPGISKRFGEKVFIEIKRKTITSPVNVSAWGSAETEVLTNPLADYKIHGGYHDKEKQRIVLQIEEI